MPHETYLFLPNDAARDGLLTVTGAAYHHLTRVRRVHIGELLRAALPNGRVLRAEVTQITTDQLLALVLEDTAATGLSPCAITLYQAVLKGEKMEMVVQKAGELGARALVPVYTRRSIPRWTAEQGYERATRWQRIADAAAAQCERPLPLWVDMPTPLATVLAAPRTTLSLLLHERDGQALHDLAARVPTAHAVDLFLGPEGGWDDDETAAILSAGAHPIHLGHRILRAETAALAALALTQFLWGDLG